MIESSLKVVETVSLTCIHQGHKVSLGLFILCWSFQRLHGFTDVLVSAAAAAANLSIPTVVLPAETPARSKPGTTHFGYSFAGGSDSADSPAVP